MPNHVINEVIIVAGDKADAIMSDLLNTEGDIDFSVLLPIPLNYWQGSVSMDHEKAFAWSALDWCRTNWGTKWNAYGLDEGRKHNSVTHRDGEIVLTFQTAWGPPRGWLVAIFNKHNVPIVNIWLSEGGFDARVETFTPDDGGAFGPEWKHAECGEIETRRLHKLLWGVEEFAET